MSRGITHALNILETGAPSCALSSFRMIHLLRHDLTQRPVLVTPPPPPSDLDRAAAYRPATRAELLVVPLQNHDPGRIGTPAHQARLRRKQPRRRSSHALQAGLASKPRH